MNCDLVVDVGNTYTRVVLFDAKRTILSRFKVSSDVKEIIENLVQFKSEKYNIILSSVIPHSSQLLETLKNMARHLVVFDAKTKLPFVNEYKTPETLGTDRLSTLAGAMLLCKGGEVLVIDAGTCITIDYMDKEQKYYGGAIMPGLNMQYKAMHEFTGRLPEILHNTDDLDYEEVFKYKLGNTTQRSMKMGVGYMMCVALDGIIENYKNKYPLIKTIITGGDAIYFERRLKNKIFADLDLSLYGLSLILDTNKI